MELVPRDERFNHSILSTLDILYEHFYGTSHSLWNNASSDLGSRTNRLFLDVLMQQQPPTLGVRLLPHARACSTCVSPNSQQQPGTRSLAQSEHFSKTKQEPSSLNRSSQASFLHDVIGQDSKKGKPGFKHVRNAPNLFSPARSA